MEKFTTLTAVAAPLPADNIDTDQLMPKQFLHGIDKSGLAQGVLYNLRFDGNGRPNPYCVFNKPGFEKNGNSCRRPELRLRLKPRACGLGAYAVRNPRGRGRRIR